MWVGLVTLDNGSFYVFERAPIFEYCLHGKHGTSWLEVLSCHVEFHFHKIYNDTNGHVWAPRRRGDRWNCDTDGIWNACHAASSTLTYSTTLDRLHDLLKVLSLVTDVNKKCWQNLGHNVARRCSAWAKWPAAYPIQHLVHILLVGCVTLIGNLMGHDKHGIWCRLSLQTCIMKFFNLVAHGVYCVHSFSLALSSATSTCGWRNFACQLLDPSPGGHPASAVRAFTWVLWTMLL